MIEIAIQNFQSIEQVALQVEGFTCLVGRSNIGKSAIIRAIKCALTGATGTDFVRHGGRCERIHRGSKKCKCFTQVQITTSELKVVWQKGDEVNKYEITETGQAPKIYTAMDRGDPEFLSPSFRRIQVGDKKSLLQVSDQFDAPFLLNETGSVIADVLSDVARLDDINEAIRLVGKDRKDATATRNVREKDVTSLQIALGRYSGLDEVVARTGKTEALAAAIETTQIVIGKLIRFEQTQESLVLSIDKMTIATAPVLPDWSKVESDNAKFVQLSGYCSEALEKGPVVQKLSGVEKVVLPELSLQPALDRLTNLEAWLTKLRSIKEVLTKYQGLSNIADLESKSLEGVQSKLEQLNKFLRQTLNLSQSICDLETALSLAEQDETSIRQAFDDIGVCPTCTQHVKPGYLHEVSHV